MWQGRLAAPLALMLLAGGCHTETGSAAGDTGVALAGSGPAADPGFDAGFGEGGGPGETSPLADGSAPRQVEKEDVERDALEASGGGGSDAAAPSCPSELAPRGESCVNLLTDQAHCGACDHPCPDGGTCVDAKCCTPGGGACPGAMECCAGFVCYYNQCAPCGERNEPCCQGLTCGPHLICSNGGRDFHAPYGKCMCGGGEGICPGEGHPGDPCCFDAEHPDGQCNAALFCDHENGDLCWHCGCHGCPCCDQTSGSTQEC